MSALLVEVILAPRQIVTIEYTRLSDDPLGLRSDHVTQNRDLGEVRMMHGLPDALPEHRFSDDDRSASRLFEERPGWLAMLDTIGSMDRKRFLPVVIASAQDRLLRLLEETPRLAKLLDRKNGRLITKYQGEIGIRKGGRDTLYVTSAVAASEAEKISVRTNGGMTTAAMAGRPHGRAGYGWTRRIEVTADQHIVRHDEVNPAEAAIVEEIARRIIARDSLASIAADLTARGVPAPGVGGWTPKNVRHIAVRKSNIAIRVHRKAEGTEEAEVNEYPATWPRLLSDATYYAVLGIVNDAKRRSSLTNTPRHLLSLIAKCGVCGNGMTACDAARSKGAKTHQIYRCRNSHVMKAKGPTDAHVEQFIVGYFSDPAMRAAALANRGDDVQAAIDAIAVAEGEMDVLTAGREAAGLTIGQFLTLNGELMRTIDRHQAFLASRRDRTLYDDLLRGTPEDVAEGWAAYPLTRQRAVINSLFKITLNRNPATGSKAFDPSTIVIEVRS